MAGVSTGASRLGRSLIMAPLGNAAGEIIAIACLTPLLFAVAFWNGFPIIYYDTGAYILEGLGRHFLVERAPVYSLFLRYGGAGTSLWLIAVLQSLLTAFVMSETARAVAPRLPLAAFIAAGAGLVAATGLPWYAGQIEPDCFTALLVLAVYLLAFRARQLGRVRLWLLIATGSLAAAAHPSHLLLAAALLLLLVGWRAVRRLHAGTGPAGAQEPRLAGSAIVVVAGLALVVAANYELTGEIFVSRAGPSFLFGRLLQDRIVIRLLDDTCPKSGYRLCAFKDELPRTADGWLWTPRSPFFALGGFPGTAAESARIVRDSLVRYPWLHVQAAAGDTVRQFLSLRTGDQIEPQQWAIAPTLATYVPQQMKAYLAARQQRGAIDFEAVNRVDVPVAALSLLILVVAVPLCLAQQMHRSAAMLGFLLAGLAANALICGTFSGPHDRYQSRLLWTVPFLLMLAAVDRPVPALRESGESGT